MSGKKLTAKEIELLRMAGEWGLLRNLAGKTVCLTGNMSMERVQLAELIEAADGRFSHAVKKGLDILVAGDYLLSDGGLAITSKLRQAKSAGVKVFSETEFIERLMPSPEELLADARASFDMEGGQANAG